MRAVLLAPLCGLVASCGLISGLDNLSVCTTSCDGGGVDGGGVDGGGVDGDDGAPVNDGSGIDAISGWTPASVTGLVLWLDAAVAVTTGSQKDVSMWGDRSGNGNNALQTAAAIRPVQSALNNVPTVHFTANASATGPGNELYINDSSTMQWGTANYYIVTVAAFDNDPNSQAAGVGTFFAKGPNTTNIALGFGANANGWTGSASTPTPGLQASVETILTTFKAPYNDKALRMYACNRSGTQIVLRVNGAVVAQQPTQPVDVSAVGLSAAIGAMSDATLNRLDGDIAELIAVKNPSAADITNIETYLQKRYALP